jgi:hypothetical protein
MSKLTASAHARREKQPIKTNKEINGTADDFQMVFLPVYSGLFKSCSAYHLKKPCPTAGSSKPPIANGYCCKHGKNKEKNTRCSAQTRTGIGLLGKPPAVKQFPSVESH